MKRNEKLLAAVVAATMIVPTSVGIYANEEENTETKEPVAPEVQLDAVEEDSATVPQPEGTLEMDAPVYEEPVEDEPVEEVLPLEMPEEQPEVEVRKVFFNGEKQDVVELNDENLSDSIGYHGCKDTGNKLTKKYFLGWSVNKNYGNDISDAMYYPDQLLSELQFNEGQTELQLYPVYISALSVYSPSGKVNSIPNLTADEMIQGSMYKQEGFGPLSMGSDKKAVVYLEETQDRYTVKLNSSFTFNNQLLSHLTYKNPGGILTNSGSGEVGPGKDAKFTHVDLHVVLDERMDLAQTMKNWSFTSYNFEPLYVLDKNYNVLENLTPYVTSDPTTTFSFDTQGNKEFIIRTQIRSWDHHPVAKPAQVVAPMMLDLGDASNISISKEVAAETLDSDSEKAPIKIQGYIDGKAKAASITVDIKKVSSESIEVQFHKNKAAVIHAEDKIMNQGASFDPLEGVTAVDDEDGEIALTMDNVIANTVDPTKPGTYQVTYSVKDSQGLETTKTIHVTVNPKTVELNAAPTIEAKDVTISVGDAFDPLKNVTAKDVEDGDLTSKITCISNVDRNTAGVYEVTYTVMDSQGATTSKTIQVTVEKKAIAPEKPKPEDTKPNTENKPNDKKDPDKGQGTNTSAKTNAKLFTSLGVSAISLVGILAILKKKNK